MKLKAVLYQIYHLAIHNRFDESKDLLMKTHMSQMIANQPVELQILYNRAYTQIGLAAFRLGRMEEAHDILLEISSNSKHRILLAQSVSKNADKTAEFEAEERKRLIPFHMQINLQVLEAFQLISSMLIEMPRAAQNQKNLGKSNFSKPFRMLIDWYDQRALTIAEESNRDFVVAAARYLNKSEWKKALDTCLEI